MLALVLVLNLLQDGLCTRSHHFAAACGPPLCGNAEISFPLTSHALLLFELL